MENFEFQRKKMEDLQRRLADAHSSIHHIELVRSFTLVLCVGKSLALIVVSKVTYFATSYVYTMSRLKK